MFEPIDRARTPDGTSANGGVKLEFFRTVDRLEFLFFRTVERKTVEFINIGPWEFPVSIVKEEI